MTQRFLCPATALTLAGSLSHAMAQDVPASAERGDAPQGKTGGADDERASGDAGVGRKSAAPKSGDDKIGNFGSGLDRGVGSGAGSTGMRGPAK